MKKILYTLSIIAILSSCVKHKEYSQKQENLSYEKQSTEQILNIPGTIDGYDPTTNTTINPLNIWEDYQTRKFAGKVNHKEKITVLKRDGDGVFIETKEGKKGWITYWFIKELKN